DPLANELELITSRTVVETVVMANALNVVLDVPRDSVLTALRAGTRTRKRVIEVDLHKTARTMATDDVYVAFKPWHEGMPDRIRLRILPFGEAVRRTSSALLAERKRREA